MVRVKLPASKHCDAMSVDEQLMDYRKRQHARMEDEQNEQNRRMQLSGPLRPSVCAEALERQLQKQVNGEMTSELRHSIFQWALLSRLGNEVWGETDEAPEATEPEPSPILAFLRGLPCLSGMGRNPLPALPIFSLPDLGPLLRSHEAVESLLLSGGCRDWKIATAQLCRLLYAEPTLLRGGWQLQLAVATALCMAEGNEMLDSSHHEGPIDLFRRYQQYCVDAVAQRLFPEFRSLRAWHFRYVLGSWHSDADLAWSRDNVSQQYRKPETIGETTKMVKYKPYNDKGVSVQDGLRFYDDQKATMPRILDYGGVCGAVSKFGASCCQAFGVAAMPVAQPGHCAMIWRAPGGRWRLENDCGGWNQSTMHAKIQRTWQHLGRIAEFAGIIPVADRAMASPNYSCSESKRLAAKLLPEAAVELLLDAVLLCPDNLCVWSELLSVLKAADAKNILLPRVEAIEALAEDGPWRGGRQLALGCPVRGSADAERVCNVVDGTDSEWFPSEMEPQWIEIDLEKICKIDAVRVKWWGDYGKKSSLKVFSLPWAEGKNFDFGEVEQDAFDARGGRQREAEFNGWTEVPGWDEPTRVVRLELGNPCPDCFGMKKSYGIRCVEVMGRHIQDGSHESCSVAALLQRLAEASFPAPKELEDQQALRLVKEMLKCRRIKE